MHANTLPQVPGDGSNEFRVGPDWERRDLESGLVVVLLRKLDEVAEDPVDFVELSRHGEKDLAELLRLQALLHLSCLTSRGAVVLVVGVAGLLRRSLCVPRVTQLATNPHEVERFLVQRALPYMHFTSINFGGTPSSELM